MAAVGAAAFVAASGLVAVATAAGPWPMPAVVGLAVTATACAAMGLLLSGVRSRVARAASVAPASGEPCGDALADLSAILEIVPARLRGRRFAADVAEASARRHPWRAAAIAAMGAGLALTAGKVLTETPSDLATLAVVTAFITSIEGAAVMASFAVLRRPLRLVAPMDGRSGS